MALTYPCLRCGEQYEQTKRRASHFCPACRAERKAEQRREYMRAGRAVQAERRREVDDMLAAYIAGGMDPDYVDNLKRDAYDRLDAAPAVVVESAPAAAPARMPPLANAPAGPDEGTSTSWKDVAEWLDQRARDVERHPWFDAHPHWNYGLHDTEALTEYA